MRLLLLTGLLACLAPAALASTPPPPPEMAYCTPADVEAKYDARVLAQRTGDAAGVTVDQDKLATAIADFATVMAPYVRGRYGETAFGTAEPTLKAINVEGSYLELAKRKPTGQSKDDRDAVAQLIRRLEAIDSGRGDLVLPAGAGEPLPSLDAANSFRANPRLFGRRQWPPRIGGSAPPLA